MVVVIKRLKLAYFPTPKVACTSLKQFMHEVKTGNPFVPFDRPNGRRVTVHFKYPAGPFDEIDHAAYADFHRFAVVRDPVKRLLSAYGNRVVHYKELSEEAQGPKLAETGLPANPDLGTFIDLLPRYCEHFGKIRHHTLPMTHFLGQDASYYTRLFRFSELAEMQAEINTIAGTDVSLQHLQRGGPKLRVEDLTAAQIDQIKDHYATDYAAFGAFFD